MFANADPLIVNFFVVVLALCLIALTIFLVRFLIASSQALDELRDTNAKVNNVVDRINNDYGHISSTISNLSSTIDRVNYEVVEPIRSVGNVFRGFETIFNSFWNRVKSTPEPEDYLPEN